MKSASFRARGFTGLAANVNETNPQRPLQIRNGYLENPLNPQSAILARQGWTRLSTTQMGSGTPSVGTGLVYHFEKLDGTARVVFICRGAFYSWTLSGGLTESLTAAQLAAASVAIDTGASVFACTFNNQMVISDGVNTPWMWDGTAGGGITKLTNAPVAYGAPTVYYAKLFFIKNADRGTIVWSEEAAANTGYEAGGYNNAWTLGQSGSQPLVALVGMNEGLYYFRSQSIGLIRGAVTSTFTTTGTHDGVGVPGALNALTVLASPGTGAIYYLDTLYRPWRVPSGGGLPEPLWRQVDWMFNYQASQSSHLAFTAPSVLTVAGGAAAQIGLRPLYQQVVFHYANRTTLVFDDRSGQYVGADEDESSDYIIRIGHGSYFSNIPQQACAITSNRTAVTMGPQLGSSNATFVDQMGAGDGDNVTWSLSVFTSRLGGDADEEYDYDDATALVEWPELTGPITMGVGLAYVSSNRSATGSEATEQTVTLTAGASDVIRQRRVPFGIRAGGNWIVLRWRVYAGNSTAIDRVAFNGFALKARAYEAAAGIR